MRDAIIKHVRPLIDQLVEDLVDDVAARIGERIAQAIDVARSALLSDLEGRQSTDDAARQHDVRGADPEECQPGLGANTVRRLAVATPAATQQPGKDRPSSTLSKRTNTCRKCGAAGFTARTCGITHNLAEPERAAPVVDLKPPPQVASRNDRFAAIEAAATRRARTALELDG